MFVSFPSQRLRASFRRTRGARARGSSNHVAERRATLLTHCVRPQATVPFWLPSCRDRYVRLAIGLLVLSLPASARASSAKVSPGPVPLSAKILRYAERLMDKYDKNGDRQLEQAEWGKMRGDPQIADKNGDGVITTQELTRRIANYGRRRKIRLGSLAQKGLAVYSPLPPSSELPGGPNLSHTKWSTAKEASAKSRFYTDPKQFPSELSQSFLARDTNGDGQLTRTEFVRSADRGDRARFDQIDTNGDGVVTAREFMPRAAADKKKKDQEKPAN